MKHSPLCCKMSRIGRFAVLALLAVSLIVEASAQGAFSCKKVTAVAPNGAKKSFNFEAIQKESAAKPFEVTDKEWTYEFAICGNVNCQGKYGPVCQETQTGSWYPLGTQWGQASPAVWIKKSPAFPKGAVTFAFPPTADNRGSIVSVVCNSKAKYVLSASLSSIPLSFTSPPHSSLSSSPPFPPSLSPY